MTGYNWSIWYVPNKWKAFMEKYNMVHVPHMTYATNLTERPTDVDAPLKLNEVTFNSVLQKFKSQYTPNPLAAVGWYCNVPKGWTRTHIPHVTWKYSTDVDSTVETPDKLTELFLAIADTRSDDPSRWTFKAVTTVLDTKGSVV